MSQSQYLCLVNLGIAATFGMPYGIASLALAFVFLVFSWKDTKEG
jgi:hypothetical protein